MRDAGLRENLWKKYEDTPNLYFWDVYIWEAHPGDPNPKPTTFAQRIDNYEDYMNQKNMTMPCLIDSIGCPFADDNFWNSQPTTFYLIGVDKKIVSVYDFMLSTGYYPRIDDDIAEALQDVTEDTEAPEVEVTAPTGGENVQPGSEYEIKYTASDNYKVVEVAIYFSSDNGSTYELVDSGGASTGTFTWEAPSTTHEQCKIKVLGLDAADNAGEGESATFGVGASDIISNPVQASKVIKVINTQGSNMLFIPYNGSNIVTLTDVRGKRVSSFTTSEGKYTYELPHNISSGMHVISVKTPESMVVKKLWLVR
ncbi:Ig-like domain-containing protein [Fibrobacterota bacterium]